MFVEKNLGVNEKGNLTIGGVDAVELAEQYGTPVYVMDEDLIRQNCRAFCRSIQTYYGGNGLAAYASKAFSCKEIYRIMKEEGMGVDVVSAGELYTAMSVGFDPDKIFFHGNNKTVEELNYALECGVGFLVVDNLSELELLDQLAKAAGKKARVLFRIKPGIDAHTHQFIRTGQIDSKFGFALETGEAMAALAKAKEMEFVEYRGIHCHIGSQIFDIEPFVHAAQVMVTFMGQVKDQLGLETPVLNLGGGYGIRYTPDQNPAPYGEYMKQVSAKIRETAQAVGVETPWVAMEPGRSIVGGAGVTLYRVGSVKEIPGIRTYVSVDGGMTDNPRYILYQSEYDMLIANKASQPKTAQVTVAGKCCESGDLLGEGVWIQPAQPGDILVVCATGAYNYSMASNYNRVPRPPVVMVKGGKSRLVVRRETLEDLVRCDL